MTKPIRKIVEHYPVDQLPAELRRGLEGAAHVTLSVMQEPETVPTAEQRVPKYLRFWAIAAHKDTSTAEAVTRIRKLRDEW